MGNRHLFCWWLVPKQPEQSDCPQTRFVRASSDFANWIGTKISSARLVREEKSSSNCLLDILDNFSSSSFSMSKFLFLISSRMESTQSFQTETKKRIVFLTNATPTSSPWSILSITSSSTAPFKTPGNIVLVSECACIFPCLSVGKLMTKRRLLGSSFLALQSAGAVMQSKPHFCSWRAFPHLLGRAHPL